ncbi:hypothetical protein F2Q70_00026758 [Brassica cretica]|uniref:Uncharacterized protein n=1 Tax=Brassica cretica TaxID=69181 RepID=A0A8S9L772_BRACR|nr:hypothetical protein F2Q70_00026758 [Brassica cretica]
MVTWFVGNSSENSDGIPTTVTVISVNRNVVGSSSVYSDEFPTTKTVTFFIGMSSKSRPTEFRRLQIFGFRRKLWLKGGLGRITDSIVPGDGVVVFYVGRSVRVWDCGEEYAGLSEVGSQWDRCASSG